MNQPLDGCGLAGSRGEIEDDGLADAVHFKNLRTSEGCSHFHGWRFKWLRLATEPDAYDELAANALVDPAGDSFDFRKLRHRYGQDA